MEKGISLTELWIGTSIIFSLILFVFGIFILIIGLYFKMKKKATVGVRNGSLSMVISAVLLIAIWYMSSKML
ncbi:hypothetical protein ABC382_00215 [Lysinibacillus sp. 1P01SD]|uniref:hypothetical protein n=1 Tax=Lysinibacillus sp. 1P01SD TaxID=3132285 RepID=UPI0039A34898